ncbi:MAG: FAD-dependent oxidoreductase, partial [Thermomicrobiales bacterium]|nr:FAD-dependent oxidoreductase [Thermomicrobiales bacterium]
MVANLDSRTWNVGAADAEWFSRNIPCQIGCPANTDVPGYLALIAQQKYDESYELNRKANVFPGLLGRVCARPCEPVCRRKHVDKEIGICHSKRAAADFRTNRQPPPTPAKTRTQRIGIVGAGPTGVTTARDLAELGYSVTIYDKDPSPGGMYVGGIPHWRLPRDVCKEEIDDYMAALGVEVKCNVEVGRDVSLLDLMTQFDAVFLGAGASKPQSIRIPGEDLDGYWPGLTFMEGVNFGPLPTIGRQVAVIGGGFTAMDCTRSSLRMGAEKVYCVYRRGQDEMLVDEFERVAAEHEGVEFMYLVAPLEAVGDEHGKVAGLKCVRNVLGEPDASGRRRPVPVEGSEFILEVDTVIAATGQNPDSSWIPEELGVRKTRDGRPIVDARTWMTSVPGLFAGGDYTAGARNLISCIADGHKAAEAIHYYLGGELKPEQPAEMTIVALETRADDYTEIPRQAMNELPMELRFNGTPEENLLKETEIGFTREESVREAIRCLQCDLNIVLDGERCIMCGGCVDVCPQGVLKLF